jgi:hypothetical protein
VLPRIDESSTGYCALAGLTTGIVKGDMTESVNMTVDAARAICHDCDDWNPAFAAKNKNPKNKNPR